YVGTGKWRAEDVEGIIYAKDRSKAGITAPAHGLYLTHVGYGQSGLYVASKA
ncbi:hypothetical protein GN156_28155, partial [bacterium LRH843]|nr:hypothetical protein [bacterium LRH843]